jgi:sarcosine oxidase, subunit gamma
MVDSEPVDPGRTDPERSDASPLRRSPLDRFALSPLDAASTDGGLSLVELPGRMHLNIRLQSDNRSAANALKRATGMTLPKPGTYVVGEGMYLGWLSPDEFLLVADDEDTSSVMPALGQKLAKVHHALNDLSSGQTIVRISGGNAAQVLAKGCTLDLHGEVFAAPMCAQTRLAKTQIFLRAVAPEIFDVVVRRSFADYLWTWLTHAASDSAPEVGSV